MEYKDIKQLIDDLGNSKLTEIAIDFPDGTKISMKKQESQTVSIVKNEKEEKLDEHLEENQTKEGNIVTSPMVGTFYMKPSPNSDPYVEVGSIVKKGTILCIIEAMKLMNEIESEYEGKVAEIFVKDGEPVEYGKPLFRII